MAETKKESLLENTAGINDSKTDNGDASPALESFLSREPAAESKPAKTSKVNKRVVILIAAFVCVAILAAVLIFLRSQPVNTYEEDEAVSPAEFTVEVSADGEHEVKVAVDANGNIDHNGTGSLLSYVPADISRIDVENNDGSFSVLSETPKGEATVYTLVGFEDAPLQEGIADEVASAASSIDFLQIVSAGGNLADFGLDKPRATVKTAFSDDTHATVRVGNDAAAEAGTYIAFGTTDAVYLVSTDSINAFLYSVTDFISREITPSLDDADTSDFSALTISGSHFPTPITLKPNTDEALDISYLFSVGGADFIPANATESSDIAGNIRGLYAESVVSVNPSDSQLASYGLSDPYTSVKAEYADGITTLHASAPNDEGLVNVYNPDKNTVYTIQLAAVCWARATAESLLPENMISARLAAVSGIDFTAGGDSYTFDVSTTSETTTDDDGNEQTVSTTEATCNGRQLTEQNFMVFFQNLNGIKNQGAAENAAGSKVLSFTLRYATGRADDTVEIFSAGDTAQYTAALNGTPLGAVSKSYVDSLITCAASVADGENVTAI